MKEADLIAVGVARMANSQFYIATIYSQKRGIYMLQNKSSRSRAYEREEKVHAAQKMLLPETLTRFTSMWLNGIDRDMSGYGIVKRIY